MHNTICKENAHYPGNVYSTVQLLLRLSNDVEENSGPTISDILDCSYTIHASFNQGNDLFESIEKDGWAAIACVLVYGHVRDGYFL